MWDLGIDVGPEGVLARLQGLPERYRALVGECEFDDRLRRLEAVLPRQLHAQGRAVLAGQWLAVGARHHERQLVRRLLDGDTLDIGPGIPERLLARGDLRIVEALGAHELRRAEGLRELHQRLHWKSAP